LHTLLNDSQLRQRMGMAGRARVSELYDYRTVARRFVDLVQPKLGLALVEAPP
jgi:glycosyltransferase involved in cell wall biosynthesis